MSGIKIKNGTVYDPLHKFRANKDLFIQDENIVDEIIDDEVVEIDAQDCIITPGLIDFHIHAFDRGSDGAINADLICLPNGVTTVVDGGTCGAANFDIFQKYNVANSYTRIKSLLHICSEGLATGKHYENQDPAYYDYSRIRKIFKQYKNELAGIKVRMSASVLDPIGLHEEPLIKALELAEALNTKVVVHVNDPNVDIEKIALILRPGDVFCHMYSGSESTILDKMGRVKPGILKAREKGVIFDACNGKSNFLFDVALPAIKDKFYPDILSTDLTPFTFYKQPLISMPRLMSKYLAMGMDLTEVLDMVTVAPARWLGEEALATLESGTVADVSIFKVQNETVKFYDYKGKKIQGNKVLVPQMTIKGGNIMYCQSNFN